MSTNSKNSDPLVGAQVVLQLLAAIRQLEAVRGAPGLARMIARKAGVKHYLDEAPADKMPAQDAQNLFDVVERVFDSETAANLLESAARSTADHLIRMRLPSYTRLFLKLLPHSFAAYILARIIDAKQDAYVAGGELWIAETTPLTLALKAPALSSYGDVWHRTLIERLFQELVSPSWVLQPGHQGDTRIYHLVPKDYNFPVNEAMIHAP